MTTNFYQNERNSIGKLPVRFASHRTVTIIDSCYNMEVSEKDETWYNRNEINKFREEVKTHVHRLKMSGEHATGALFPSFRESLKRASANLELESVAEPLVSSPESIRKREMMRGLEHKINNERLKIRHIARLAVLEAQRRLKLGAQDTKQNPVLYLSFVASKFSKWAKEIALEAGKKDASDAYPTTSSSPHEKRQPQFVEEQSQKPCQKKARTGMNSARLIEVKLSIPGGDILRRKNNAI